MRRNRSRSSALWWVTNGCASAPPYSGCSTGVSTSRKSRSSSQRRIARDHAAAQDEELANLLVCDQVEVTVAVAGLHVLEAVELVGRGAQRLCKEVQPVARRLSSPRRERKAVPSMPIRSPRSSETRCRRILAEDVAANVHLHLPGAVHQVEEGRPAVAAPRREPAGDAVGAVGLLPVLELGVLRVHPFDRDHALEGVRERFDAVGAQALELRATVIHARELYAGSRRRPTQCFGPTRVRSS